MKKAIAAGTFSNWHRVSGQILKWYLKALIGPEMEMSAMDSSSMIRLITSSRMIQLRMVSWLADC